LRAATERRWRELAGDGPSAEAWERFGTLIDECAFAALLKAVAGDPARPTVVRVVWAPHQWFGMDVPGSRFAGGPGADQSYAIIPIDFGTRYTISGQWIGDRPADLNYTLAANAYFMNAINTLQMDEIDADADRRFTLTVGPEAGGRNHIRTFPGAQYLFVRDCRSDWKQSATALRVTALDPPRTAPWDDEQILVRATQIALDDAPNMFYWVRLFQGMEANRLTGPALTDDVGGLVSQTTAFARLVLSPGDVAVITAQPGDAAYGRLAVISQALCEARMVMTLPAAAFTPPPKVSSAVVHLTALPEPRFPADPAVLNRVVAMAFNQRRKMLRSALKGLTPDIEDRLRAAGLSPTDRAEQVPLEGFCALAREVAGA